MGDVLIATNASVNSLASFHAVMEPQAVYSASLTTYSFHTRFELLNLKLCGLIIACSTLSQHNTLSACTNRLWCLPTWYYTQSSLKFGTALGG